MPHISQRYAINQRADLLVPCCCLSVSSDRDRHAGRHGDRLGGRHVETEAQRATRRRQRQRGRATQAAHAKNTSHARPQTHATVSHPCRRTGNTAQVTSPTNANNVLQGRRRGRRQGSSIPETWPMRSTGPNRWRVVKRPRRSSHRRSRGTSRRPAGRRHVMQARQRLRCVSEPGARDAIPGFTSLALAPALHGVREPREALIYTFP